MLENFQEIVLESPADKISRQIRSLIASGQLKPGDRLPPERKLAEKLGVSRTHVREGLQKLEFYGILKTLPQSGTIVAGLGITALGGLISDVLKLDNSDFASLVETRVILETHAARLAAQKCTPEDVLKIQQALIAYEAKVRQGKQAIEEDLMFHIKIAEASRNSVLKSLMLIIVPDIVHNFLKLDVCKEGRFIKPLDEHQLILEHISRHEADKAAEAMRIHLQDVLEYSYTLKNGTLGA